MGDCTADMGVVSSTGCLVIIVGSITVISDL